MCNQEAYVNLINEAHRLRENSTYSQAVRGCIKSLFIISIDDEPEIVRIRLTMLDQLFSTQMYLNIGGIDDIAQAMKNLKLSDKELVADFISFLHNKENGQRSRELLEGNYGKLNRRATSLISKYSYFLTKGKFPIYDSLVSGSLRRLSALNIIPNNNYRKKETYFNSYRELMNRELFEALGDDAITKLDAFGWIAGKLSKGKEPFTGVDCSVFKDALKNVGFLI